MNMRLSFAAALLPLCLVGAGTACSTSETTDDTDAPQNSADVDGAVPEDGGVADTDAAAMLDSGISGPDASGCGAYTGVIPNDAGAQCHDLVNSATAKAIIEDPGALPVGSGGTFGEGLYHMTEVRAYPGSPLLGSGITFKTTILVVGDMSYSVNDNSNEKQTVRKITRANPDGGEGIVLCTTKVENNPITETSSTATCNSLTTYDTNFKFSATLTKQ